MPEYVDGFVIAVPKKKMKEYIQSAKFAAKIWREHGALDYRETMIENEKTAFGVSFPKLVQKKPSETIIFSWIVFKSRKHRDAVNARVMKDKRLAEMMEKTGGCPFELDRMTYGGFETVVK